jgi:hypothetical protein
MLGVSGAALLSASPSFQRLKIVAGLRRRYGTGGTVILRRLPCRWSETILRSAPRQRPTGARDKKGERSSFLYSLESSLFPVSPTDWPGAEFPRCRRIW